jgi:chromosomal replication initiator protein
LLQNSIKIMKQDVFNQYVDRVCELFSIPKDEIFSKNKKRELVDARYLIYYLCAKRPMKKSYIQRYMREAGYDIKHSSIIHGIAEVQKRIDQDKDYVSVVKELERSVFI